MTNQTNMCRIYKYLLHAGIKSATHSTAVKCSATASNMLSNKIISRLTCKNISIYFCTLRKKEKSVISKHKPIEHVKIPPKSSTL